MTSKDPYTAQQLHLNLWRRTLWRVMLLHHVALLPSPPRILCSYQQHVADYVHLSMEEGEELTLDED